MDIKILDKHKAGTEQSFVVLSYRCMLTILGTVSVGIALLLILFQSLSPSEPAAPTLASEVYSGSIHTTASNRPNESLASRQTRSTLDNRAHTTGATGLQTHATTVNSNITGSSNGSLWSASYFHTRHEQNRGPWPRHEEYVELQVNNLLLQNAQKGSKVGIVVPQLKQSFQGIVNEKSSGKDGGTSLSGVLDGYTFPYVFYVSAKAAQVEGVIETPLGDFVLESEQQHIRIIAASEISVGKPNATQKTLPMLAQAEVDTRANRNSPAANDTMVREDIFIWEENKTSGADKTGTDSQALASNETPVARVNENPAAAPDLTTDYSNDPSAEGDHNTYSTMSTEPDLSDASLDPSYAAVSMYNDYGAHLDPYATSSHDPLDDTGYDKLEADEPQGNYLPPTSDGVTGDSPSEGDISSQEANETMADNFAAANQPTAQELTPSDADYVQYDAEGNAIDHYNGPIQYADPTATDAIPQP